jgi:hypothetical protein
MDGLLKDCLIIPKQREVFKGAASRISEKGECDSLLDLVLRYYSRIP